MFTAGVVVHDRFPGIVGLGRIGRAVARRARGFDMEVLYFSRTRHPEWEQEPGVTYCSLPELLARADFVTLHTNLTAQTRHLIGEGELALMKSEAVLVNPSRGGVVDQEALYRPLVSGRIRGAGLNVFERKPVDHPLIRLPSVAALPHVLDKKR